MSAKPVSDKEIARLLPTLKRLAWADPETRGKLQQLGVDVIPVSYYSTVPSMADIEESYEYREGRPPYLDERLFQEDFLRQFLEGLKPYARELDVPVEGDEERCTRFFWKNSMFSYSDAMAYYCMVRQTRPARIVEIGSGFSSLLALEALRQNGHGSLHCIEPYPRPFLKTSPHITLHEKKAQEIGVDFLNDLLQDGDILFIDSTHTVKTGSDCLHLYLRLLPHVRRNIRVHVHDVFLPCGMPQRWLIDHQYFWTEQYLLMAFLLDNPRARILYGSHYHLITSPAALEDFMAGKWTAGGGSLWIEYQGRKEIGA